MHAPGTIIIDGVTATFPGRRKLLDGKAFGAILEFITGLRILEKPSAVQLRGVRYRCMLAREQARMEALMPW
jgi:hypothetical protein